MVLAPNGKFYGITERGGSSIDGVLFEYDYINNSYTVKINLDAATGSRCYTALLLSTNGKIYGTTIEGGTSYAGILFEYDNVLNTYTVKNNFDHTNGENPQQNLVQASNGKIYATAYGGPADRGILYEFDTSTGVFAKKIDFGTTQGAMPFGNLVQGPNGKLYGVALGTGDFYSYNNISEAIFEYDWVNSIYTKKKNFTYATGENPWGGLMLANNGKLYGMTFSGGPSGRGTIYEYDRFNDTLIVRSNFSTQLGCDARYHMVQGNNGKLYGMVTDGGPYWYYGIGGIVEFDPYTGNYSHKVDFYGIGSPYGGLTQASNGKLYGVLSGGVYGQGLIYEYDYVNNIYTKKIDLTGGANGTVPLTSMLEVTNGKLLGTTNTGGADNKGVLFEYDYANNTYTKLHDFDSINGTSPAQYLMKGGNGKIYGMTTYGGANNLGVLFEYDYASNVLTKKSDFNGYNGRNPYGSTLTEVNTCTAFNSITATGCNSYTSPSGLHTWYTSGTYLDTFTTSSGCDSVLTINLNLSKTYSTINPVECDSFTSSSGNYTWTVTGTYTDTLTNATGCDSIITIHLLIAVNSNTVTLAACDSFVSPTGMIWTTSGIYHDTIPNMYGCDSVLIFHLTITHETFSSQNVSACDSYTSPSENYVWTSSGIYVDTISADSGCNSIITINLTVNPGSAGSMSRTVCGSFTSPSGNYTWTASGIYSDTLVNTIGCDSVITINLTVIPNSSDTISPAACTSYTSPSGNYTWTVSGIYSDTLVNVGGCDSVITINLTIIQNSNDSINPVACSSFTSPSGNYTWTTSGIYTDTLPDAQGCDSILVIFLTIDTVDVSVINLAPMLTANASGAVYQWLDCNNGFAQIPGATSQSFTATANGSYAVQVTQNSCTDTSICITITNVGLTELGSEPLFFIFPNPADKEFTISGIQFPALIKVYDVIGREITSKIILKSGPFNTLNLSNGIYTIKALSRQGAFQQKIIVSH